MGDEDDEVRSSSDMSGPGKGPMNVWGITVLTGYLLLVAILVIWALIALWPPLKPSELNKNANANATQNVNANENANQNKNANANANASPNRNVNRSTTANSNATANANANANSSPNLIANTNANANATAATAGATPLTSIDNCAGSRIRGDVCFDEDNRKRVGVAPARVFGWCGCLYDEDRLLMIVLLAGALGSLIHGLRSFVFYVGSRRAVWSWGAYYIALPFIGAGLAFIFYLVIRGGFFSTGATVENTSPVGFAALAALIGMFTEQAVQKLRKISDSVLAPPEKGKDHISGPKITSISPPQGPPAGLNEVKIAGENFSTPVKVTFGAVDAPVKASSSGLITATVPAHPNGKEGKVDVIVINTDNQKDTAKEGYEYKNEPVAQQPPKPTKAEPPTITSLSLELGGAAGGDAVTITGTNFSQEPAATVAFGGTPAIDVQVKGLTSIELKTPPHAAGTVDVTVKNPDGNEAVKTAAYTFW
jgi:IPT/TIG domain-containing protein